MGGNFAILNPCPKKWSDLAGEGRVRFCDTCKAHVHSISEYSPEEWSRLWRESDGHLCALLSSESPEPPRSRRAILIGALLTAAAPLFAQSGRLRIRVTDITGAVVPNADISLPGTATKATTDESGQAVITGLPIGDSQISIRVPGFNIFRSTVTIQGSDEQKLDARLQIGTIGDVVTVNIADTPFAPAPQAPKLPPLDLPVVQPNAPSYARALPTPDLRSTTAQPSKRHWWQIFH